MIQKLGLLHWNILPYPLGHCVLVLARLLGLLLVLVVLLKHFSNFIEHLNWFNYAIVVK